MLGQRVIAMDQVNLAGMNEVVDQEWQAAHVKLAAGRALIVGVELNGDRRAGGAGFLKIGRQGRLLNGSLFLSGGGRLGHRRLGHQHNGGGEQKKKGSHLFYIMPAIRQVLHAPLL